MWRNILRASAGKLPRFMGEFDVCFARPASRNHAATYVAGLLQAEGRKSVEDAKRAKVFTKLIREITVATRAGVADPAANPRLRTAIDKALSANMTRDTIDRAVKRGSGADGGADMHELRYEGYGPHGVAVDAGLQKSSSQAVDDEYAFYFKFGHNHPITGARFPCEGPDVTMTLVPPAPTSTVEGPRSSSFWELLGFMMPANVAFFPAAPMLTQERPVDVVTVTA